MALMNRVLLLTSLLAGCLGTEPEPEQTDEVESWVAPLPAQGVAGQGSNMQGSNMQGSNMQGSNMQGSNMQGSSLDGATHGGSAIYEAAVGGTAIFFWKKIKSPPPLKAYTWEYRSPTRICKYNQARTQLLEPCTNYSLANSPVIGSTWRTTFVRGTEVIPVTLRIEAVSKDPTKAMHPLRGSDYTTSNVTEPCDNPARCHKNDDMFNYDVKAIDVLDDNGQNPWLCPSGYNAIALTGQWQPDGTYLQGAAGFTFACTNGVIAKCTRWGYRPFDRSIRANDPSNTQIALRGYNQACTRAAMADYCGIAHSFTKNGTYVDVFDYESTQMGFIPETLASQGHDGPVTAFGYEARFDQKGATLINTERYAELASSPEWAIGSVCPGKFGGFDNHEFEAYARAYPWFGPFIGIKSAPMCAHSEFKVGKWLYRDCSACAGSVPGYCNDSADPRGWDQGCVNAALASTTCANSTLRMAAHSECTTGVTLEPFDTGCTLQVCSSGDPNVAHCCSNALGAQWDQACVAKAGQVCNGGSEHRPAWGFCTASPLPPDPLPPILN
jgi:ADYC domain/Pentapeptide repeats (8 copies)